MSIPTCRGSKYWKVKLQRKSGSKWRTVGIYRTHGATETRAFGVKAGTYRVKVYARPGYRSVTTPAYRFTPTHPSRLHHRFRRFTTDTTAPGVVTGLAMVGRTATSITLAWTNPSDPDLAAVMVRRAVGGTAPATPGDGVAVALPTRDGDLGHRHRSVVDTGYAYAVFTRDATGNTSPGVPLVTRTLGPAVMSTTRVSVRSDGGTKPPAATSGSTPAISADGRWITFASYADEPGRQRHQRAGGRVPA